MPAAAVPNIKNILLIIPQLTFGGAERVFYNHSTYLGKTHKVYECIFNSSGGIAFRSGNELIDLNIPAGRNVWEKLYYFFLKCWRIRAIKKQYNIQVAISHLEGADYVNILSKGSEKVILCVHNSKIKDPHIAGLQGHFRKKVLIPFLYRFADKIVPVSQALGLEIQEHFHLDPAKIVPINNAFDITAIRQRSAEEIAPAMEVLFESGDTLITVGRFSEEKNHRSLIACFVALPQRRPLKLLLIGDGPLRDALAAQARNLGAKVYTAWSGQALNSSYDIYFLGFQHNPFQFIARSTAFMLPSLTEGFPMALCEAMACGLPVISTDCHSGPREILAQGKAAGGTLVRAELAAFGVLVPVGAVGDASWSEVQQIWVATLLDLFTDRSLLRSYAEKAIYRIADFSQENIMSKWQTLLEN